MASQSLACAYQSFGTNCFWWRGNSRHSPMFDVTPDGNGRVWRLAPAPGLVPAPSLLRSFSIRSILERSFPLSQSKLVPIHCPPSHSAWAGPFCLSRVHATVLWGHHNRICPNRTGLIQVWENWWVGMEGMSRRWLCGSSVHEFRGHGDQPWNVHAIVGWSAESQRVDLAKFRFV